MERLAGRIILLWGWRRALVAFLAGALVVLAQAPYDFIAVGFVSFPLLVWLLDGTTPAPGRTWLSCFRPAFAVGWWFGFGYFLAGVWWIGGALLVEAESFAWALPLAVLGVPLVLAMFYGFAAALARLLWSDGIGRILALAFGFGLAEWLRSFVLTGFPWNAIGYAAMPVPVLMQSVWLTGMTGMNALAVFVFAAPALLSGSRHRRLGIAIALLLCLLHAGYGMYRLSQPEPADTRKLLVRVVQPSVLMSEKWDPSEADAMFADLMRFSAEPPAAGQGKPQLIVWPETSVPFLFTERPDALAAIGAMLTDDQMLLAGAVRAEGAAAQRNDRYYNAVVAIDAGGEIVGAVDKVHLVPFGEYLPFSEVFERFGLEQIVAGPMNFQAGSLRPKLAVPGGLSASAFICYEIIFPDEVAVDVTSTDIIVNVTNDAWFGDTPGPYQHFRQAQVRAIETGLPLVRAANTGISGAIDSHGRLLDAFAIGARGFFDVQLPVPTRAASDVLSRKVVGLTIIGLFGLFALVSMTRRRFASA